MSIVSKQNTEPTVANLYIIHGQYWRKQANFLKADPPPSLSINSSDLTLGQM